MSQLLGRPAAAGLGVAAALVLAACSTPVGPDYQRPNMALPASFQPSVWREANPADQQPKGNWWSLFEDPLLDQFEREALANNNSIQAAVARIEQARALAAGADAAFQPSVNANANASRTRTSANRTFASPTIPVSSTLQNEFTPALAVRWEADLAGRLRRGAEAARAAVGQSEADAENVRLLISTSLANDYLGIRALDADLATLEELIREQLEARDLESRRIAHGQATALDLTPFDQALQASLVQRDNLRNQRAPLVNAIAVLLGVPAGAFRVEPAALPKRVPEAPAGVPSELLERRPDVASAERSVAQANALIGVAAAARYPSLVLGGSDGLDSRSLGSLLQASSLAWALSAALAQTVYDGGRVDASVAAARAAQQASAAQYRDVVLNAMSEVETGLASEQTLALAQRDQRALLATAHRNTELARRKQAAGLSTSADVLAAEQAETLAARADVELQGQRLLASVFLIKALGGRW